MDMSTHLYSAEELKGMIALTTAGTVSFLSIIGLVLAMIVGSIRQRHAPPDSPQHHFVRTHVGIYFLCLLLCDFAQSIASIMSIDWVVRGAVRAGQTCTAQGIIYQFGNVGSALWSLAIATHTFALLFLRCKVSDMACWTTFVGVWVITGSIVGIGPLIIQNQQRGPFHGLSGPWCWITEEYSMSRLGLEYFWMFFSAFLSFLLYTLVFLRLRGNIYIRGWTIIFRFVDRKHAWNGSAGRETVDSYVLSVARQMLWYPVAYTVTILPVAICRWTEFGGGKMPLSAVFATDFIFLLSGFVNVVLFTTTRRVIPKRPALPTHSKSSRDITTFMGGAVGRDIVYAVEPDSPTTEDGNYPHDPQGKKKAFNGVRTSVVPSEREEWSRGYTPPSPDGEMFFAPSSPDLRSIHSITFCDVGPIHVIPIHLQQIPTLIMTPPSPSPSQMTTATVTTMERERAIAMARSEFPALTRF